VRIACRRRLEPSRPAEAARSSSRHAVAAQRRSRRACRVTIGTADRRRRRLRVTHAGRTAAGTQRCPSRRQPALAGGNGIVSARRSRRGTARLTRRARAARRSTARRCSFPNASIACLEQTPRRACCGALRRPRGRSGRPAPPPLACPRPPRRRPRGTRVAARRRRADARRDARGRLRRRYRGRRRGTDPLSYNPARARAS
jgi:hypothetical protein